MNDFGLPAVTPTVQPETPVITPPKKKFPLKIAAGVLMVFLLAAGVFVTDRITLQRQIIESQGKTAKMKPKDVKKKEDCGGASNGGWQVWRGGGCKITGISGSTDDGGPDKDTPDPSLKTDNTSEKACEAAGNFWCVGCGGFCLSGSYSGGGCAQAQQESCGEAAVSCSNPTPCTKVDGTTGQCCPTDWKGEVANPIIYYCTQACYNQSSNVSANRRCDSSVDCAQVRKDNDVPECFNGVIQVDSTTSNSHMSYKNTCGEEEKATAAEVLPSPSPSPGVSPSPSPSPNVSCIDLTSNKTAPTMGDTVNFTCKADFSAAAPVAIFRHNISGGSYTESAQLPLNSSGEAGYSLTVNQTGNWSVQCRVCTDSTATTCTAWGQAQ